MKHSLIIGSVLSSIIWMQMSLWAIYSEDTFSAKFKTLPLVVNDSLEASMKRGLEIYQLNCQACHGFNGEGVSGVFPPLAKADYLMADKARSIRQTIKGISGEMLVNGVTYYGNMPAQALNNRQIADVLNYIRNSWGNQGEIVTIQEVAQER